MNEPSGAPRSGAAATRDAFWLILTAYLSQLLTLAFALVLRRELGPAGMGYVAVTQLVATYASFSSLGALQAAEREIPIAIARGNEETARSLELAGVAVGLAVSVLVCAALFAIGVGRSATDPLFGAALICASLVMLALQASGWATVRLRTRLRFRALGWSTALSAVVASVLAVAGALLNGAMGALVGVVVGAVFQSLLISRVAGIGRIALPPRTTFRHLASLSPAFFASGAVATLLLSVDQIAVGFTLGTTSLGLYSAAYLGNSFVLRVPTLVDTVIYPRLQRELGTTSDAGRVFAMASRATGALVITMPVLVATFFVALPALVFLALPEYRDAIGPMRLLLIGVAGLAFSMPAANYLMTVNRQWSEVAISGSILVIMASAYVLAAATGVMSLQVAAGVDVVGYLGFGIVMQVAAHRAGEQPAGQLLRFIPMLVLPMIELLVGAGVADALVPRTDRTGVLLHAGLQAVFFAVTWSSLAWLHLRAHPEARDDLLMATELVGRTARRIGTAVLRLDHQDSDDSVLRS